jgi:hypothetical protein
VNEEVKYLKEERDLLKDLMSDQEKFRELEQTVMSLTGMLVSKSEL